MYGMEVPLLMRAWMMAHLYGAEYQAVVCLSGSNGEAAFRESLEPHFMSPRHDTKMLYTYYIIGTCDGTHIRQIGGEVQGADSSKRPLHITVTSNANCWHECDLSYNTHLVTLGLQVRRFVQVPAQFLAGCSNLEHVNLAPLRDIEVIPDSFLSDCSKIGYHQAQDGGPVSPRENPPA